MIISIECRLFIDIVSVVGVANSFKDRKEVEIPMHLHDWSINKKLEMTVTTLGFLITIIFTLSCSQAEFRL